MTGRRPLQGIRVADFTNHAAGPQATLLLALLGAEVIRIESHRRLDIQRRPHPVYGRDEVPTFDHLAAHKKSITLDLKTAVGMSLARELIAASDVVAESFRPGVMRRLGLDWETIRSINPAVVMLSLSTYGQTGPDAQLPGYAPIFAAAGGLGWLTGYRGGAPVEIRNPMDHTAGLYGAFVVLAALDDRERTGSGRYIDLSAREVAISLVGESVVHALRGMPVERIGNEHELWVPHGVFPCAGEDRWVALVCRNDDEWSRLASHIADDWARLPQYRTSDGRRSARRQLDAALAHWTKTRERDDLARELQCLGLPADRSMNAADLLEDEHLTIRESVVTLNHPAHGTRRTAGSPWLFSGASTQLMRWSPELGADNETIICGLLGHTPDELAQWIHERSVY